MYRVECDVTVVAMPGGSRQTIERRPSAIPPLMNSSNSNTGLPDHRRDPFSSRKGASLLLYSCQPLARRFGFVLSKTCGLKALFISTARLCRISQPTILIVFGSHRLSTSLVLPGPTPGREFGLLVPSDRHGVSGV